MASIDTVSTSLPFGVDEYGRVNKTYERWVKHNDVVDQRNIDVWTYCYVQRYFAVQFLRSSAWMRSDADRLIDVTLQRLRVSRYQLRNPERYTSWVVSICRNTYLTYVRTRRVDGLDDPESVVAETRHTDRYDIAVMYEALSIGIERLPWFLKDTAQLRLVEGKSYRAVKRGNDVKLLADGSILVIGEVMQPQ